MATTRQVTLVISAQDQTKGALDSTASGIERLKNQVTNSLSMMSSQWVILSAKIYLAQQAIQYATRAFQMMEDAAQFDEQRIRLNLLARQYQTTGDTIVQAMQRAAGAQITMREATEVALSGLSKGMTPEMLIGLSQAAEQLSDIIGKDTTETLKMLTESLERGTERSLKAALGVVNLKDSHIKLNEEMSETEKLMARHAIIMYTVRQVMENAGGAIDTNSDFLARQRVEWAQLLDTILDVLMRAGVFLLGFVEVVKVSFQLLYSVIISPFAAIEKGLNLIGVKSTWFQREMTGAAQRAAENWEQAVNSIRIAFGTLEQGGEKAAQVLMIVDKSTRDSLDSFVKLDEQIQKLLFSTKETTAELINQAGAMALAAGMPEEVVLDYVNRMREALKQQEALQKDHLDKKVAMHKEANENILLQQWQLTEGMINFAKQVEAERERIADDENRQRQNDLELLSRIIDGSIAEEERLAEEKIRLEQLKIEATQDAFGNMASALYVFATLAGKTNRALFIAYKAFAISEALISTYAGAARALKDFPYPFSMVVAATVIAAGLARVAQIAAMSPGGAGAGGGAGPGLVMAPTWEKETKTQASQSITVNIYGNVVDNDKFARDMQDSIKKAMADGA